MTGAKTPTLADKILAANNRPAGFDYMRLVLATGVIAQHTINTSYGQPAALDFWATPARLLVGPILPMFFALSGFLVAGSLVRCASLVSFFGLRALRILPALAVEVTLSALILGPLLTTVPLSDYFASPQFAQYFLNIAGIIHYRLPGMFPGNPVPLTVNGQLWTVPYELECYAVIGLLAVIGITWHRRTLLVAMVAGQLLLVAHGWFGSPGEWTTVPGRIMVYAFLCGLTLFSFRDKVRWSAGLFAAAVAVSAVLLLVRGGDWLVGMPIAYVTVFLGIADPPRQRTLLSGDYSYGLFLYGFPIQQMIASLGPAYRHWWINLGLALPLAAIVAVASWWVVERPALTLKTRLLALEAWLLATLPRWTTSPFERQPERLPMLYGKRLSVFRAWGR